jgi:hypothetical protein
MTAIALNIRDAAIQEARRVLARKPIIIEMMPTSLVGGAEVCAVAAVNWRRQSLFHDVIRPTVAIDHAVLALYGAEGTDFYSAPTFRDVWDGYLRSVLAGERTAPEQPLCVWRWPLLARALRQSLDAYDLRAGYIKPPLEIAPLVAAVTVEPAPVCATLPQRCARTLNMLRGVAAQECSDAEDVG